MPNCLINNKVRLPEPAKALSWVVDKKDARIIIGYDIDGDEYTKLNGAFIKTLVSGGDAMEGRKLYEMLFDLSHKLLSFYVKITFMM
jgi:hypothetical protein